MFCVVSNKFCVCGGMCLPVSIELLLLSRAINLMGLLSIELQFGSLEEAMALIRAIHCAVSPVPAAEVVCRYSPTLCWAANQLVAANSVGFLAVDCDWPMLPGPYFRFL